MMGGGERKRLRVGSGPHTLVVPGTDVTQGEVKNRRLYMKGADRRKTIERRIDDELRVREDDRYQETRVRAHTARGHTGA